MLVKVVDASAVGAVIFGEPEGPTIVRQLARNRLVAPELIFFELASVCVKKLSRYPESRNAILESFGMLKRLAMQSVEVEYPEIVLVAERYRISAYDASYLWLARGLEAELVTLDKKLRKVWRESNQE